MGSLRGDSLLIKAFLETAAPRRANLVLVLEIAMGIGLLAPGLRKGRGIQTPDGDDLLGGQWSDYRINLVCWGTFATAQRPKSMFR